MSDETKKALRSRIAKVSTSTVTKSLILSYDEGIDKLKNKDFRNVIASFLIELETNCKPMSPTSSTIIFESNKENAVIEWTTLLKNKFKEKFFFVIAEIAATTDTDNVINGNYNGDLVGNFEEISRRVKKD